MHQDNLYKQNNFKDEVLIHEQGVQSQPPGFDLPDSIQPNNNHQISQAQGSSSTSDSEADQSLGDGQNEFAKLEVSNDPMLNMLYISRNNLSVTLQNMIKNCSKNIQDRVYRAFTASFAGEYLSALYQTLNVEPILTVALTDLMAKCHNGINLEGLKLTIQQTAQKYSKKVEQSNTLQSRSVTVSLQKTLNLKESHLGLLARIHQERLELEKRRQKIRKEKEEQRKKQEVEEQLALRRVAERKKEYLKKKMQMRRLIREKEEVERMLEEQRYRQFLAQFNSIVPLHEIKEREFIARFEREQEEKKKNASMQRSIMLQPLRIEEHTQWYKNYRRQIEQRKAEKRMQTLSVNHSMISQEYYRGKAHMTIESETSLKEKYLQEKAQKKQRISKLKQYAKVVKANFYPKAPSVDQSVFLVASAQQSPKRLKTVTETAQAKGHQQRVRMKSLGDQYLKAAKEYALQRKSRIQSPMMSTQKIQDRYSLERAAQQLKNGDLRIKRKEVLAKLRKSELIDDGVESEYIQSIREKLRLLRNIYE